MRTFALALAIASLSFSAAIAAEPAKVMETSAGKIFTNQNGMALYTYGKDTKGTTMSACVDACIKNWPPFLAEAGATPEGAWTLVQVKDKDGALKSMWAYDGWPLYMFVNDTKPGQMNGEGIGGVWHVAKPD